MNLINRDWNRMYDEKSAYGTILTTNEHLRNSVVCTYFGVGSSTVP